MLFIEGRCLFGEEIKNNVQLFTPHIPLGSTRISLAFTSLLSSVTRWLEYLIQILSLTTTISFPIA